MYFATLLWLLFCSYARANEAWSWSQIANEFPRHPAGVGVAFSYLDGTALPSIIGRVPIGPVDLSLTGRKPIRREGASGSAAPHTNPSISIEVGKAFLSRERNFGRLGIVYHRLMPYKDPYVGIKIHTAKSTGSFLYALHGCLLWNLYHQRSLWGLGGEIGFFFADNWAALMTLDLQSAGTQNELLLIALGPSVQWSEGPFLVKSVVAITLTRDNNRWEVQPGIHGAVGVRL